MGIGENGVYRNRCLSAAGLPHGLCHGARAGTLAAYPVAFGDAAFLDIFLIRVYAWMGILSNSGLINNLLIGLGLIDTPLRMMNTQFAVVIGIVYAYLPFMVLPLYAHLTRLDNSLLEAASDLGSRKINTFIKVTLPLSMGGIIAGSMLVFIPAVGEFVIPELLGGPDTLMIGKVLWEEFFLNRDWPVASALAMVMLLMLLIPIVWFHRYQSRELEE